MSSTIGNVRESPQAFTHAPRILLAIFRYALEAKRTLFQAKRTLFLSELLACAARKERAKGNGEKEDRTKNSSNH